MRDAVISCSGLEWVVGVCNVDPQVEFELDEEPEGFCDLIESVIGLNAIFFSKSEGLAYD